jgi:hypothetical protein
VNAALWTRPVVKGGELAVAVATRSGRRWRWCWRGRLGQSL